MWFFIADILKGISTVDSFTEYTAKIRNDHKGLKNLCIIPTADNELISVRNNLMYETSRETVLKYMLKKLDETDAIKFDYVFVDCPGAMDVLTLNALVAADVVIVFGSCRCTCVPC